MRLHRSSRWLFDPCFNYLATEVVHKFGSYTYAQEMASALFWRLFGGMAYRFLNQGLVPGTLGADGAARRTFDSWYSLVEWPCASHCGDLSVHVAICGKLIQRPTEQDPICAAATRFYKYLVVDYSEELAMSVKVHIFQALTVTFEGSNEAVAAAAGRAEALKLQRLYGKDVLPDDILAFLQW